MKKFCKKISNIYILKYKRSNKSSGLSKKANYEALKKHEVNLEKMDIIKYFKALCFYACINSGGFENLKNDIIIIWTFQHMLEQGLRS